MVNMTLRNKHGNTFVVNHTVISAKVSSPIFDSDHFEKVKNKSQVTKQYRK